MVFIRGQSPLEQDHEIIPLHCDTCFVADVEHAAE